MKEKLCFTLGAFGAWIAGWFGGWNSAMTTLVLFMAADYATGLIVAAVFQRSPKTETGGLQSKAGLIGLIIIAGYVHGIQQITQNILQLMVLV